MKKIVSIVGARPQFIKAAIVSRKLREAGISEVLVHTGQHYDFNMSAIFLKELDIPKPGYNLGVGSGSHAFQTGKILVGFEDILLSEKPDMIIVYGDTNSTLAGALAAAKLQIPIAHVEAGVRSFNKMMAEEINRVATDHVSDILFAPTEIAVQNLTREGIKQGVYHVGDVMFDIALTVSANAPENMILNKFALEKNQYILTTIHRAENTDIKENLEVIYQSLIGIAEGGKKLFFPMHPRTRKALNDYGIFIDPLPKNMIIHEPVSYREMIVLEKNARMIITDSGGVQKEGYFFKIPSIIPRYESEWVELIDSGWAILAERDQNIIMELVAQLWDQNVDLEWKYFFGKGNAADKIAEVIGQFLK